VRAPGVKLALEIYGAIVSVGVTRLSVDALSPPLPGLNMRRTRHVAVAI
jgi:hypothetical protein